MYGQCCKQLHQYCTTRYNATCTRVYFEVPKPYTLANPVLQSVAHIHVHVHGYYSEGLPTQCCLMGDNAGKTFRTHDHTYTICRITYTLCMCNIIITYIEYIVSAHNSLTWLRVPGDHSVVYTLVTRSVHPNLDAHTVIISGT